MTATFITLFSNFDAKVQQNFEKCKDLRLLQALQFHKAQFLQVFN